MFGIIEILFCVSLALNIYLVRRGIALVDAIDKLGAAKKDIAERNYIMFDKLIRDLRNIDLRGAFEADDEVGSVFKEILSMVEFYSKLLNEDEQGN